jgi:hypothetical protein
MRSLNTCPEHWSGQSRDRRQRDIGSRDPEPMEFILHVEDIRPMPNDPLARPNIPHPSPKCTDRRTELVIKTKKIWDFPLRGVKREQSSHWIRLVFLRLKSIRACSAARLLVRFRTASSVNDHRHSVQHVGLVSLSLCSP